MRRYFANERIFSEWPSTPKNGLILFLEQSSIRMPATGEKR